MRNQDIAMEEPQPLSTPVLGAPPEQDDLLEGEPVTEKSLALDMKLWMRNW